MNRLFFLVVIITFSIANLYAQYEHYEYEQALSGDNVRCISIGSSDDVWIGSVQGLAHFDGETFTRYTTDNGLGSNLIYDLYVDTDGSVWAATSGGLSVYNGLNWTNYGLGEGMPSNTIWSVTGDGNGTIWFGTSDIGGGKINGGTITTYGVSDGLISNSVKTVYVDRSGNTWFGKGVGVSMFNGIEWTNFNQSQGLPGGLINDIIQLKNGNMCLATNGGLAIYNYYDWSTITTADGLPNNSILTVVEDDDEVLLVGCSNGLVEYVNSSDITVYNYENGLTDNIVIRLAIDSQGLVWVASPFTGVTCFDRNSTYIIYRDNRHILNDEVNVLLQDEDDALWVGSNGGINRVKGMHWRSWDTNDGLIDDTVKAIYIDANDKTWVGTVNGISIIDGTEIIDLTDEDGLTHNDVRGITGDGAGRVYVATADKMTVIEDYIVIDTISIDDGLQSDSLFNTYFDTNDGRLWILGYSSIDYLESGTIYDANLICVAETPQAIIPSNVSGVLVGSELYLHLYPNGNTASVCQNHALNPTVSKITSIYQTSSNLIASYQNGEVYSFNGATWSLQSMDFPVSYITGANNAYEWYGLQTDGLLKVCPGGYDAITFVKTNPLCIGGVEASITITQPLGATFEYSIDNGENWQSTVLFNNLISGYYSIVIKDNGVIVADSITYIQQGESFDAVLTIEQISCNGDDNGSIELSEYAPNPFIWENGNTTITLRENLVPASYHVTVSSVNCNLVLSNDIVEPDALDIIENYENVACFGDNTGSVGIEISGGTEPYTILWDNGSEMEIIEDLIFGEYSYSVTDASGCNIEGSISVNQPSADLTIVGTPDDLDCYGDIGCIQIDVSGGAPFYSYHWSDDSSSEDICDLPAGEYSITITDANECTATQSYNLIQPDSPLQIEDANISNVLCNGESSGEIDITISGGTLDYDYEWDYEGNFFSTDEDLINIDAGDYSVTISDANQCSITESYNITESDPLSLSIDLTPITCPGHNDAILYADISGGSEIYSSFIWTNQDDVIVGVTQTFTDVAPGEYSLLVTDSYYCTITDIVLVEESIGSDVTTVVTDAVCYGSATGSIQVLIDGGTPAGAHYQWEAAVAGDESLAENLLAGSYSVTVTEPAGCVNELIEIIGEPAMEDIGVFPENGELRFCSGDEVVLDAGDTYVSYTWSNGEIDVSEITIDYEDTYTVLVEDNTGCVLGDTVDVIIGEVYQDEALTLVSVNSSNQPVLYWAKTEGVGTDYYNVYRENDVMEWELIGNVDNAQPAIYIDTDIDASETPVSYRISTIDTCGNESDYSDFHTSMYLTIQANQYGVCTLDWTTYEGFFVVYYFIYSGETEETMELVDSTLYNDPHYVEMNPYENGAYYQVKVRTLEGCEPGDGEYYFKSSSSIEFCENMVGIVYHNVNGFKVYPSLVENSIHVEFDVFHSGDMDMAIYNNLGQKVYQLESDVLTNGFFSRDYDINLAPGVYILKCRIGKDIKNVKLIKQ